MGKNKKRELKNTSEYTSKIESNVLNVSNDISSKEHKSSKARD